MMIRKAKLADCKQVWEMCKIPQLVNPSGEPPKLWWIKSFVMEKQLFLIAEQNDEIIGFIFGERTTGDVGYLWCMAVKKEFQGRNLGKKLLKMAEQEFKKRNIRVIVCYGFAESKKVINMLKKFKYEQGRKYYEFIKFI